MEYVIPIVALAVLATIYVCSKETAVVAGKVFDGHKQPAGGTQVRIGNVITYADAAGRFQFADVPFGHHVLSIRHGDVVKERSLHIRTRSLALYETIA